MPFHLDKGLTYLAYVGIETDLIFTQGIDLPNFASFPLLDTPDGRDLLRRYYRDHLALCAARGCGAILESATWIAQHDRAQGLGYDATALAQANKDAIALIAEVRDQAPHIPCILSANIGPQSDGYAPAEQMDADAAEAYHAQQIAPLAETQVDVISGYTLTYPAEAIGIAQAAMRYNLPVVLSFTVETDGHLPTGETLGAAIAQVDQATNSAPAYYMINCAHPDHFSDILAHNPPWLSRLGGIVANASRCSHAELDNAETLDAGDPVEFGQQLADLKRRIPHLSVLGGCCGTDLRHLDAIMQHLGPPPA